MAAAARPEPTVFRVRTGRISEQELRARLERQGFRLRPVDGLPSFHRVEDGPLPVSLTLEHWDGLIYVQQASTGSAAAALGARPGERVLDLCAAPGGKTSHVAELMGDRGCLVASEVDERRIRGLLGNLYRLLHPGVLVVACDGTRFPEGALFDRVLVDAPCSGEGTLRRRSGEAPNQSKAFVARVTRLQRALLEKAVRLTRPGGTVLYATCTFAPEENEAVVSDVLAGGSVELEPLALAVPHAPGLTSFEGTDFDPRLVGAARIYPHHLDSGGLFLAKLRRLGDEPSAGWLPVPCAFPEGEPSETEARSLVASSLEAVAARYGATGAELASWRWAVRGGRVWAHSAEAWPLGAWAEGAWRAVALGIRAIEIDSAGRARPTNDLLRLLGDRVRTSRVELTAARLASLLAAPERVEGLQAAEGFEGQSATGRFEGLSAARDGEADTARSAPLGPVALALDGVVVGRGAYTRGGLVSEIPRARAVDLERALSGA